MFDEPEKKPSLEDMLAGILAAIEHEMVLKSEEKRERVVLTVESSTRGYYKLAERVSHLEGDEKRTLREAVESLYDKLVQKARSEERSASERLVRLGVRT